MAIKCIKPSIAVIKLKNGKEYPEYESLAVEETKIVENYFSVCDKSLNFLLKMIHLESSVQLVFYLTLLIANVSEIPLMELNYNEQKINWASTKWIFGLILLLLKTTLSGYTTFSSIFKSLKRDSYKLTRSAPSIIQYVSVVLSLLLELLFSATINFLLWS